MSHQAALMHKQHFYFYIKIRILNKNFSLLFFVWTADN